jgi:hypothetical protein
VCDSQLVQTLTCMPMATAVSRNLLWSVDNARCVGVRSRCKQRCLLPWTMLSAATTVAVERSYCLCRGSTIAGVSVLGDLLVTGVRISADMPSATNPPMHNGLPVTTQPVAEVLWLDASPATVHTAAATSWNTYCRQSGSLVHRCS